MVFQKIMQYLVRLILKFIYRIEVENINLPKKGKVLVVGNHVSYMDAIIFFAKLNRPVRFVMYHKIYNWPILKWGFRAMKAIPICSRYEDKEIFEESFVKIKEALDNGEAIFIFPEGKITYNGEINKFKGGVEKILKETPAPVYPIALQGMWGSIFSRQGNKSPFKRWFSKIKIIGGELIHPEEATKERLEKEVLKLRGEFK